jgi:D-galactonate transporter
MENITLNPAVDVAARPDVYRRIAWRLMPFIVLCYCCAYLDRVNVGFAKLRMLSDLHFTDVTYGLGAGIFFVGYFFFEVPSNLLLHKFGARKWITRIMLSWGVISALTLFVHTPAQFYIARFMLGAAEAGFSPGIMLYLTYWFPAKKRGTALGFYYIAIPLAGIIGGPLSGIILHSFAQSPIMRDWQWLFLFEAIPSLIVGLAVLFFLTDRPEDARWLSQAEKHQVTSELAAEDRTRTVYAGIKQFLKDANIWKLTGVYFCQIVGLYGLSFWLPSIIKSTGIHDLATLGWISTVPYIVAIPAIIITGLSADRFRTRRLHFALALVVGAAGFAASGMFTLNLMLTVISLSVAAAGILSGLSLFWGVPTAFLAGTSAAVGIAFINSIGSLAGFVSPYMVGWLNMHTGNAKAGLFAVAAFMVLGALAVKAIPRQLGDR